MRLGSYLILDNCYATAYQSNCILKQQESYPVWKAFVLPLVTLPGLMKLFHSTHSAPVYTASNACLAAYRGVYCTQIGEEDSQSTCHTPPTLISANLKNGLPELDFLFLLSFLKSGKCLRITGKENRK